MPENVVETEFGIAPFAGLGLASLERRHVPCHATAPLPLTGHAELGSHGETEPAALAIAVRPDFRVINLRPGLKYRSGLGMLIGGGQQRRPVGAVNLPAT